jgi:hypothetical protein
MKQKCRDEISALNSATLCGMKRYSWIGPLVAILFTATLTRAHAAKTLDFDALTIADINHAFDSGALTSEKLVQLCLARIDAYDRKGPSLHAVMTLNPKALETARALDAERKAKGPRSPLHGIPIVLRTTTTPPTFPRPAARCCSKDRCRRPTPSWSRSCARRAPSSSRR